MVKQPCHVPDGSDEATSQRPISGVGVRPVGSACRSAGHTLGAHHVLVVVNSLPQLLDTVGAYKTLSCLPEASNFSERQEKCW